MVYSSEASAVSEASTPVAAQSTEPSDTFESFGLLAPLLRGLADAGFTRPTAIQARALPPALAGRDLMASAQTGTGKTAAFVLPALQYLLNNPARPGKGPRVLVLTPTRELATQVAEVIALLGRHAKLRSGNIVGGVSYSPQESMLRNGVELLVATPGRLMDHMSQGLVDFSRLELFVLDEADRMLDMGFIKPVQRIAAALPKERQTLLYSATLEGEVLKVAKSLMKDPLIVQMASNKARHEGITQRLHVVEGPEQKHTVLSRVLADPAVTQAIVFTATKRGADRLAKRLTSDGHSTLPLHGNMRQNARRHTVDQLRRGKVQILVATDVAARGIDLLGVSHVINFDLPTVAEDYIHRIGRTGRNGAEGTAISIVGPQDRVKLGHIERLTGQRLVRYHVDTLPPVPPRSAAAVAAGAEAAKRLDRSERSERPERSRRPSSPMRQAPRAAGAAGAAQPSAAPGESGLRRSPSRRPQGAAAARSPQSRGNSHGNGAANGNGNGNGNGDVSGDVNGNVKQAVGAAAAGAAARPAGFSTGPRSRRQRPWGRW